MGYVAWEPKKRQNCRKHKTEMAARSKNTEKKTKKNNKGKGGNRKFIISLSEPRRNA